MRTKNFSAKQLERLYFKLLFGASFSRMAADLRQFFTVRDRRRKSVLRSLLKYGMKISARHIADRLLHPFTNKPTIYSRKPAWYDL
jgi:hypothetical protein